MPVYRVIKNENYTCMSNYHLKDTNLSFKAKGLLSVMLSLPKEWDYSAKGLETLAVDGNTAVRSALKELEENNYLCRERIYSKGKILDWQYSIFENPSEGEKYKNNIKQDVQNQVVENQQQGNNNNKILNQLSIKQTSKENITTIDSSNIQNSETSVNNQAKKKPNLYTKIVDLINSYTENEYLRELLIEYWKICKSKAKERGKDFFYGQFDGKLTILTELSNGNTDSQITIIEYSVKNRYSTLYPVHKNYKSNKSMGCDKNGIFQDNIEPDRRDHSGEEFRVVDEGF